MSGMDKAVIIGGLVVVGFFLYAGLQIGDAIGSDLNVENNVSSFFGNITSGIENFFGGSS